MKIFVVVNHVREIGFRQTTALLIAAFVRLGHEVSIASVDGLFVDASPESNGNEGPRFLIRCKTLPAKENCDFGTVEDFSASQSPLSEQVISPGDLIFIRTNPGREKQRISTHDGFMNLCQAAKLNGIRVENDPGHMNYFANKASLIALDPQYRSPLLVSNNVQDIVEFVRRSNRNCIVKSLVGMGGQSVARVRHDEAGLESLIRSIFGTQCVVAQHFAEANHPGDKRAVVLDGKVLELDGHLAGIERRPAGKDFRANLHDGGTAHPLTLDESAMASAEYAADMLFQHGIRLAGVDLVGDKIIEFNVFSAGGLFDAESYSGVDFSEAIAKKITADPI